MLGLVCQMAPGPTPPPPPYGVRLHPPSLLCVYPLLLLVLIFLRVHKKSSFQTNFSSYLLLFIITFRASRAYVFVSFLHHYFLHVFTIPKCLSFRSCSAIAHFLHRSQGSHPLMYSISAYSSISKYHHGRLYLFCTNLGFHSPIQG